MAIKSKEHYVNNKDFFAEIVIWNTAWVKIDKVRQPMITAEAARLEIEEKAVDVKLISGLPMYPQIPDTIARAIIQIAERYATKPCFFPYKFRADLVAEAVHDSVRYAHKFDPAKSQNPFAYFTQITHNSFLRTIEKEKKQSFIKFKAVEAAIEHATFDYDENGSQSQSDMLSAAGAYDNPPDFLTRRKRKRQEKKAEEAAAKLGTSLPIEMEDYTDEDSSNN